MALTPPEFIRRLTDLSQYSGQQFGRLQLLYVEENKYHQSARNYRGYWAFSDAFKCFFLETKYSCATTSILPMPGPCASPETHPPGGGQVTDKSVLSRNIHTAVYSEAKLPR